MTFNIKTFVFHASVVFLILFLITPLYTFLFKRKPTWKIGMYVGIIFNLITGIIPFIFYSIPSFSGEWGIIFIIPLYVPLAIIPYLNSVLPVNLGYGYLIVFFFISLIYYGGIGAITGYFLSKIIENKKEPLQKEKDISGEDI